MYKVSHDMVPDSLKNLFRKTDQIHDYQTRQAGFNFLPPKPNTNYRKKAVSYRGTVTWNNFPNELKSTTSIQSFKNKIKKLYLFN